jgi:hypothetical protein
VKQVIYISRVRGGQAVGVVACVVVSSTGARELSACAMHTRWEPGTDAHHGTPHPPSPRRGPHRHARVCGASLHRYHLSFSESTRQFQFFVNKKYAVVSTSTSGA